MDYREMFYGEIKSNLINANLSVEDVQQVLDIVVCCLANYEITERCTEIAVYDNYSEELIKMFVGSKLTEGKSERTAKVYAGFLLGFYHSVSKPLVDVTTMDIRQYLAIRQRKVSLATIANNRSYLASFYQWLFNEEIIAKNPLSKINPVKKQKKIKKSFSSVEIDQIRSACTNIRDRAIVETLISSGLRISELCSLKIQDVDLQKLEITVTKGKGNKQRKSYINPVCRYYIIEYLKQRTDDSNVLFMSRNKREMHTDTVRDFLYKIEDKTGIDNIHPHRFRRTFATDCYEKGLDIRMIQKMLGHARIETTLDYIDYVDSVTKNEYMRKCS